VVTVIRQGGLTGYVGESMLDRRGDEMQQERRAGPAGMLTAHQRPGAHVDGSKRVASK
jgi:hypothetical protein